MYDEGGVLLTGDSFEKAMNTHYSEKYAGLSRPILGLEVFSLKEPRWALKNLIQEDGITMIHGSPGSGKSLMAMDWAYCLAHPSLDGWMGQPRSRQFKPMYIFTEGIAGLRTRSQAWQMERNMDLPADEDGVLWVRDPVRLNRTEDPKEPYTPQVAALFEMFNDYSRDLLIVDTLANTFGGNENSQQDANNYLATIRMFVNAGAPVVIVHHNTKEGNDFRGSTVFEGAVDTKVAVKESNANVHLYITKQKDGDPGFNLDMRIKPHIWENLGREFSSVTLEQVAIGAKLTKKQRATLDIVISLGDKATVAAVAKERGGSNDAAYEMLKGMQTRGHVKELDGVWYNTLEVI